MADDTTRHSATQPGASPQAVQQRLVTALRERVAEDLGEHVEQIETHISILLMTHDRVYKIKKAITLDFVDYSSLEHRRACCETELRLNRRFAPDLYLRCVAIGGAPSAPGLGAEPVLEYAVEMQRFPAEAQGDVVARDGHLTLAAIDALAETIAGYHARAANTPPDMNYGCAAAVSAAIRGNRRELGRAAPEPAQASVAALDHVLERLLEQAEPSLSRRHAKGWIRECHGDMHLANLIYRDGRWAAFDCVEFDPALRWIDVMDDLAFTLMDLYAYGLAAHAHRLLNRYLETTGDYDGLGVLRPYLVHRALVRAKIALLSPTAHRFGLTSNDYLGAAAALAQRRARLIITHGISGSGKSRAAAYLAERFGYIHIRSDIERKRLYGLAADDHSHRAENSPLYARNATTATYDRLLELARPALAAGWPVILDATFLERRYRDAARALAARLDCRFHILDLDVPADIARQRIQARGRSDASDADQRILDQQLHHYRPLAADERYETWTTSGNMTELAGWLSAWEAADPAR